MRDQVINLVRHNYVGTSAATAGNMAVGGGSDTCSTGTSEVG